MAKPKPLHTNVALSVRVDSRIKQKYELLLADPLSGKIAYGSMRIIIEQLLSRLLDTLETNAESIPTEDLTQQLRGNSK